MAEKQYTIKFVGDTAQYNTAQKQVAASINELQKLEKQLKETRDKSSNPDIIKKYNKEIANVQKEMSKIQGSSKSFFDGLKQNWLAVTAAAAGFGVAVKKAFDAAKGAAQKEQLLTATREQFGVDADAMIKKLKEVSGGTITSTDLIKSANKAMALGVTTDIGQMAKLLEVARIRARSMGIDTSEAFDNLATGLGRVSPLILDNLGIKIPAGFDKMTEGMTEAEKKQALLNIVLADGAKLLAQTGKLTNTTAEDFQAFETSLVELGTAFGEFAVKYVAPAVKELTKFLDSITNFEKIQTDKRVAQLNTQIAKTTEEYNKVNEAIERTTLAQKINNKLNLEGEIEKADYTANGIKHQKDLAILLSKEKQLREKLLKLSSEAFEISGKLEKSTDKKTAAIAKNLQAEKTAAEQEIKDLAYIEAIKKVNAEMDAKRAQKAAEVAAQQQAIIANISASISSATSIMMAAFSPLMDDRLKEGINTIVTGLQGVGAGILGVYKQNYAEAVAGFTTAMVSGIEGIQNLVLAYREAKQEGGDFINRMKRYREEMEEQTKIDVAESMKIQRIELEKLSVERELATEALNKQSTEMQKAYSAEEKAATKRYEAEIQAIDDLYKAKLEAVDTSNMAAEALEKMEEKDAARKYKRLSKREQEKIDLQAAAAKREEEIQVEKDRILAEKEAAKDAAEVERNKAKELRQAEHDAAMEALQLKMAESQKAFRKAEYELNQKLALINIRREENEAVSAVLKKMPADTKEEKKKRQAAVDETRNLFYNLRAQINEPFPFATGGFVPGTGDTDSVSAVLTPGEYVIPKAAAIKYAPILDDIRSMRYSTNNINNNHGMTFNIGSVTTQAKDGKQLINELLKYSKNLGSVPFAR